MTFERWSVTVADGTVRRMFVMSPADHGERIVATVVNHQGDTGAKATEVIVASPSDIISRKPVVMCRKHAVLESEDHQVAS